MMIIFTLSFMLPRKEKHLVENYLNYNLTLKSLCNFGDLIRKTLFLIAELKDVSKSFMLEMWKVSFENPSSFSHFDDMFSADLSELHGLAVAFILNKP
jgi:hypothetical protein